MYRRQKRDAIRSVVSADAGATQGRDSGGTERVFFVAEHLVRCSITFIVTLVLCSTYVRVLDKFSQKDSPLSAVQCSLLVSANRL